LLGLAALVICGLAVAALAVTLAVTATGGAQTEAAAAATGEDGWIPLRSTSPSDIIAAVSQGPLLAQSADSSAGATRLGTPLLVHGLASRLGDALPDVYVVPLLDRSGRATEAAEAVLNPTHSALHVTTVVTFTHPRSPALVAMSATAALDRLLQISRIRHLALQPSGPPRLVYFPVDAQAQAAGGVIWRAGGEDPANPIWLIPTAGGQDYVVGTNGAVYTLAQLPIAASA
jgi:hypothetical protein